MKQGVKIALLGFGTVGQGTVELLTTNLEVIQHRINVPVIVDKIYVIITDKYINLTLPSTAIFVTDYK